MARIDESMITHKLNMKENAMVVKQKRRKFDAEKNKIIHEKVEKMVHNNIREVQYLEED